MRRRRTIVVVEADRQVDGLDLLLEEIVLVEEQDDGGLVEPLAVADLLEQRDGLVHAVDALVLVQLLVVLARGDAEDERSDVLEAVNPLLALVSLATDVDHSTRKRIEKIMNENHTSSRAQKKRNETDRKSVV